jgi:hypothetical protein
VQVRRLAYFHLLPSTLLAADMFRRNARGLIGRGLAWLSYLVSRLLLPRLLGINAKTAARGLQLMLSEFDYFDGLIAKREAEVAAAGDGGGASPGPPAKAPLPFYLCGSTLSAADVSLATLAGPLVELPPCCAAGRYYVPPRAELPAPLRDVVAALTARPTGQYVVRLWDAHGIALMAAGTSGGSAAKESQPTGRL